MPSPHIRIRAPFISLPPDARVLGGPGAIAISVQRRRRVGVVIGGLAEIDAGGAEAVVADAAAAEIVGVGVVAAAVAAFAEVRGVVAAAALEGGGVGAVGESGGEVDEFQRGWGFGVGGWNWWVGLVWDSGSCLARAGRVERARVCMKEESYRQDLLGTESGPRSRLRRRRRSSFSEVGIENFRGWIGSKVSNGLKDFFADDLGW